MHQVLEVVEYGQGCSCRVYSPAIGPKKAEICSQTHQKEVILFSRSKNYHGMHYFQLGMSSRGSDQDVGEQTD